jgi:hypothetical protein
MSQIALPLAAGSGAGPSRIVVGNANAGVIEALGSAESWPFRTAVLFGPPRSGKSLIGRWFAENGVGEVVDDAERIDETELFHRWNRAQESGRALLLICNGEEEGWRIALPDLKSRLGAALHLSIGAPDDAMLAELIALHAEHHRLILGEEAAAYLVPRAERSHLGVERLVGAIDRISLERKAPASFAVWRDALDEVTGPDQPRLL